MITLAAVGDETLAAHIRPATIARAQDNRCFALTSFLVGRNYMAADEGSAPAFTGKSGIYAPLEMTPRYAGVLVEMGTAEAEGLLTAELDRPKLQWLWTHGSYAVRGEYADGLCSAATCPRCTAAGAPWPMPGPRTENEAAESLPGSRRPAPPA